MNIALMTRWNMPSGQSAHAEPLAHIFMHMGHNIIVFAPGGLDIHLRFRDDEPFVRRCYMMEVWGQRNKSDYFFDRHPFLADEYDVFIVEDMEYMPMPEMLEIFPQIKKKAKTILVVHETGLPQNPDWYRFDWDAIVCFDRRYKEFLVKAFPADKIFIIPFPCLPVRHGDKTEARRQLGLPLDGKIVFSYGFSITCTHGGLFPTLASLNKENQVSLLLVTHHDIIEETRWPDFVILKPEMPEPQKLDSYLHAADVYLYYARQDEAKTWGVGVSSSVAACLGAGRPVLVPAYCNFFDLSGDEVVKFEDLNDLEHKLQGIFNGTLDTTKNLTAAEDYITQNSCSAIASQLLYLLDRVLNNSSGLSEPVIFQR